MRSRPDRGGGLGCLFVLCIKFSYCAVLCMQSRVMQWFIIIRIILCNSVLCSAFTMCKYDSLGIQHARAHRPIKKNGGIFVLEMQMFCTTLFSVFCEAPRVI